MFREFTDRIAAMNASEQVRVISSLRQNKARTTGALLKCDPASMEGHRAHFAAQFVNQKATADPEEIPAVLDLETNFDMLFTSGNIEAAIQELASGKATGKSGIPAEALKAISGSCSMAYQILFRCIARWKMVPKSWTRAKIQPVPKKGDLTLIKNYRPIYLTEVPRKLFESLLLRPDQQASEPLSVEQGGFRRQRGTLDQIAVLQEWISQSKAAKLPRYMAFLDIKALMTRRIEDSSG